MKKILLIVTILVTFLSCTKQKVDMPAQQKVVNVDLYQVSGSDTVKIANFHN